MSLLIDTSKEKPIQEPRKWTLIIVQWYHQPDGTGGLSIVFCIKNTGFDHHHGCEHLWEPRKPAEGPLRAAQ